MKEDDQQQHVTRAVRARLPSPPFRRSDCITEDKDTSMKAPTLLASYRASRFLKLFLVRGSVVDFGADLGSKTKSAAIVNAANEGCLGGGGVDRAISNAGGPTLLAARLALPIVSRKSIRCLTGQAVLTGPGDFGSLHVPYVIHAVGPNYYDFEESQTEEANDLLLSAYQKSLDLAFEHGIGHVGFSLLSSGLFRGPILSQREVLEISVDAIRAWEPPATKDAVSKPFPDVYLCGFSARECNTLVDLCEEKFSN